MQSKYQVQAHLTSLLVHSSAEQRKVEDQHEKLRQTAAEYKKHLESVEDANTEFEQYIRNIHLYVTILEEDIHELREQNELLKDHLALALLAPLANEVNEVQNKEERSLEYEFMLE
jgi:hypothetical protein